MIASGCKWENCSDIPCVNGFYLKLLPLDQSSFATSTLDIDIDEGNGPWHFECTLTQTDSRCVRDPSAPARLSVVPIMSGEWIDIREEGRPTSITLRVTRGGNEIANHTFTPNYVETHPGGPDCDTTCHSANDSLKVP